jgi:hypothetical protein
MKNPPRDRTVLVVLFLIGVIATLGLIQLYTVVLVPAFAPPPTLDQQYISAIEDSMIAKDSEISSNLTPIWENNSNLVWQGQGENATVLMVTWTKYANSYPVGQNVTMSWGDTWVTAAPQIQVFFRDHTSSDINHTLRAAQLLGMPANTSNTYFVELWVNPQSLFRPTPDNEVGDTTASLSFPANATAEYKDWFNSNIIYSYYPMRYPWTRLGYTYDWGSSNHVGLSEFIISPNSTVTVKSVASTTEYLRGSP